MPVDLDKFYTKPSVAQMCINILYSVYKDIDFTTKLFIEPSAGAGAFSNILPHCFALDLKPESENIFQKDFFDFDISSIYKHCVTVGNPPFGHRSDLAIKFFNHATKFSDVIAFIVPVSFCKWNVQKLLNNDFKLVSNTYLQPESFTVKGEPYSVRTVFQIWSRQDTEYDLNIDLRLKKAPPISHTDFNIWQHNATEQSREYVYKPWEIATWRQGYKDFNKYFTQDDKEWLINQVYNTNQQFFFIQPLTDQAREIILNMDFNQLAERNTSTPGFGKSDFVSYYLELERTKNEGL